jgi:hypothetical protein
MILLLTCPTLQTKMPPKTWTMTKIPITTMESSSSVPICKESAALMNGGVIKNKKNLVGGIGPSLVAMMHDDVPTLGAAVLSGGSH